MLCPRIHKYTLMCYIALHLAYHHYQIISGVFISWTSVFTYIFSFDVHTTQLISVNVYLYLRIKYVGTHVLIQCTEYDILICSLHVVIMSYIIWPIRKKLIAGIILGWT